MGVSCRIHTSTLLILNDSNPLALTHPSMYTHINLENVWYDGSRWHVAQSALRMGRPSDNSHGW
jgi:hypothetical protein